MKTANYLLLILLWSITSLGNDMGDRNCQVFVVTAYKQNSSGIAVVAVHKSLLKKNSQQQVFLKYRQQNTWQTSAPSTLLQELNSYFLFDVRWPAHSESQNLIAVLQTSNGGIYDNNSGEFIMLSEQNTWRYNNEKCENQLNLLR